jgi:predicted O-methyltransferase YrrM
MNNFNEYIMTLSSGQMLAGDLEILMEFSKDKKSIVELGTSKGLGAMVLSANGARVFTIDNYSILDEENAVIDTTIIDKDRWEISLSYFLSHWSNIVSLRGDTADSASRFGDDSVDLLYIDGDHRFYGVERDYDAWISKVKSGGYILFHDYDEDTHPDVVRFCSGREEHDDRIELVEYETEYPNKMRIFRKVV